MKNLMLATLILVGSTLSTFAQDLEPNSVKLKVKQTAGKFKYNYLPELLGYSDYNTYEVKLTDVNGEEYIARSSAQSDVQVKLALSFIENLKPAVSGGDFLVEIKRLNSSIEDVSVSQYPAGNPTPETTYGYVLKHNDKFQVSITDAKGGNGVVFDTTFTANSITEFPKDYDNSIKIKSKNSLPHYYNEYIYKNVPKEFKKEHEEEYEAMKIKESKDVTEKYYEYIFNNNFRNPDALFIPLTKTVNSDVKKALIGLVSREWETKVIWLYDVKAKDETYEEINLAIDSFDQAMEAMNENFKNEIYINFHAENVFTKMDAAYTTFNKFRSDKYVIALQEKVQQEYKSAMNFNVFFTALATSRYDQANEILSQAKKDAADNPGSALKRSDAEKTLALMEQYAFILKRERRLYDEHKEAYNFYK